MTIHPYIILKTEMEEPLMNMNERKCSGIR